MASWHDDLRKVAEEAPPVAKSEKWEDDAQFVGRMGGQLVVSPNPIAEALLRALDGKSE